MREQLSFSDKQKTPPSYVVHNSMLVHSICTASRKGIEADAKNVGRKTVRKKSRKKHSVHYTVHKTVHKKLVKSIEQKGVAAL